MNDDLTHLYENWEQEARDIYFIESYYQYLRDAETKEVLEELNKELAHHE